MFQTHSTNCRPNLVKTLNFFDWFCLTELAFNAVIFSGRGRKCWGNAEGFSVTPLVPWHPRGTFLDVSYRSDYAIIVLSSGRKNIWPKAFLISLYLYCCRGLLQNYKRPHNGHNWWEWISYDLIDSLDIWGGSRRCCIEDNDLGLKFCKHNLQNCVIIIWSRAMDEFP